MTSINSGQPISLQDRAWFEARAHHLGPHFSERAFANIYLWRRVHHYHRHDTPLPHVSGETYDGVSCVLPLFDIGVAAPADLARIVGDGGRLYPISEETIRASSAGLIATYNSDDSDYLFERAALADLRQAKERRRQALHFCKRSRPICRPFQDPSVPDALAILEGWLNDVARPMAGTDFEVCREAIELWSELGLFGLIAHCHDGEPAGFLLASAAAPDMAVIHFAKARRHLEGAMAFLFRAFARRWVNYTYLNFEQDLGNPGFRQSKMAYAPLRLLNKHRAAPRQGR